MDSRIRVSKVDNVTCWRVGRGIEGTVHLQLHHLCRDFTFFSLHFRKEADARDVYDTIRCLTCKVANVEKLYAFSFRSPEPERAIGGWKIYDPRREFKRMGISAKDSDKGWRITEINNDYQAR
ncbi:phosphatidylinositol-3-phosphatase ymr1 [Diplodia seriata]